MTPSDAIAALDRGELTQVGLLRALIAHPTWSVPVPEDSVGAMLAGGGAAFQLGGAPDGGVSLMVFSSDDAYRVFQQQLGPNAREQHFLTTTGAWVFNSIPAEVTSLYIDPFSPHGTTYDGAMLPAVRSVAAAVEIEEALLAIRTNPDVGLPLLPKVKDYNFGLAIYQNDAGLQLCMAPDSKDRRLVAITTCSDNQDAYLAEAKTMYPGEDIRLLSLEGSTIGRQLSQMTSLEGMVFNPCGPSKAVAFAMPFAGLLAQA